MMNLENIDSEELIQELLKRGYIRALWHKHDIIHSAEILNVSLTNDQITSIIDNIESNFDANVGVNWDVINYHIQNHIHESN